MGDIMKKNLVSLLITLILGGIIYYIALPPLNIHCMSFWFFVMFLLICFFIVKEIDNLKNVKINLRKKKIRKFSVIAFCGLIFAIIIILNVIYSPLFMSKSYANRIKISENNSFTNDIKEVDFTKLPLLDKESSQKLGDRVMGQMSDLVSQYSVSSLYTQINYNNQIVRVTPLEYASFIKWITNRKEGIKGYIMVNSVDGETTLKRLTKGIKYSPSAYFNDNLNRKLRFSYPTLNFGKISFEVDNDGNPYWIAPIISYKAVGLRAKVTGVVILDPITGKSIKCNIKEIPKWVDIAFSADLIIEQVDDWGTYKNGFWNSAFGQKNVVKTTDGYNYLAMDDDIYLYTGITSVVSDESNLGFILTNMRTSETKFYSVPGAEEYSAMASAEGAVQQMKYTSTFPLLINLNNKPTYLVSLKDAAGLVKMYGFVAVTDYQKVVVTDSSKGINVAANNYLGDSKIETNEADLIVKTIKIKTIKDATISGNTYYYITDEDDKKYKIPLSLSDNLPFLKQGSEIKIGYTVLDNITTVKKVY